MINILFILGCYDVYQKVYPTKNSNLILKFLMMSIMKVLPTLRPSIIGQHGVLNILTAIKPM